MRPARSPFPPCYHEISGPRGAGQAPPVRPAVPAAPAPPAAPGAPGEAAPPPAGGVPLAGDQAKTGPVAIEARGKGAGPQAFAGGDEDLDYDAEGITRRDATPQGGAVRAVQAEVNEWIKSTPAGQAWAERAAAANPDMFMTGSTPPRIKVDGLEGPRTRLAAKAMQADKTKQAAPPPAPAPAPAPAAPTPATPAATLSPAEALTPPPVPAPAGLPTTPAGLNQHVTQVLSRTDRPQPARTAEALAAFHRIPPGQVTPEAQAAMTQAVDAATRDAASSAAFVKGLQATGQDPARAVTRDVQLRMAGQLGADPAHAKEAAAVAQGLDRTDRTGTALTDAVRRYAEFQVNPGLQAYNMLSTIHDNPTAPVSPETKKIVDDTVAAATQDRDQAQDLLASLQQRGVAPDQVLSVDQMRALSKTLGNGQATLQEQGALCAGLLRKEQAEGIRSEDQAWYDDASDTALATAVNHYMTQAQARGLPQATRESIASYMDRDDAGYVPDGFEHQAARKLGLEP